MRFTVVLSGPEDHDRSYGLVFVPCPVWVQGRREVVNPHPDDPRYRSGDFARLLKAEQMADLAVKGARCAIVVHAGGNGTDKDRDALVRDVRSTGFDVTVHGTGSCGPMKDQLSSRLYEAITYAHQLHGRDARKGSQVPVMAHLLNVCALVQQDGGDEDEAIAALLHDALEDKSEQTNRDAIQRRFGQRVLDLILVATDTPSDYAGGEKPPWHERKQRYLERVRQTSSDLLRVTVADKVDNARAILADHQRIGDEVWERFNAGKKDQLWYYRGALEAYAQAGVTSLLMVELARLVEALERPRT